MKSKIVNKFSFVILLIILSVFFSLKVEANIGDFLFKWGTQGSGDGQFQKPRDVALGGIGDVYVAEQDNNRIHVFDSNGTFKDKWGSSGSGDGEFNYPSGLAVDVSGDVYVVDDSNHRIQVFDSNGLFLYKWGNQGSGDGELYTPRHIALDNTGNVYVVDNGNHRIQVFDSNGNFITNWGGYGSGDGEFYYPNGIAVAQTGNVYVGDSYNHRIQVFDSNGSFITKWGNQGSGDGEFNHPSGLAVDGTRNVYVADYGNHRIQVFDSNGNFITKWGSFGSGNGQFDRPNGIAVSGTGNVYVAENYNHRIQVFEGFPDAKISFSEHVIFSGLPAGWSSRLTYFSDIDSDGDTDVIASTRFSGGPVWWFENSGGASPTFTTHQIDNHPDCRAVFATDLDGDGDTDLLSASALIGAQEIRWYENNGAVNPTFSIHVIPTTAIDYFALHADDIDGDGDTDIISGSGPTGPSSSQVAWHENIGGSPLTFVEHELSRNTNWPNSIETSDLDGDGDVDIIAGSLEFSGDPGEVVWYENDGSASPNFTQRVIAEPAGGIPSVDSIDLDDDGDIDIIAANAIEPGGNIFWYENNGDSPPEFTERIVNNDVDGRFVFPTDIDNDGDFDILAAQHIGPVATRVGQFAYYENKGGSPLMFVEHIIATIPKPAPPSDLGAEHTLAADFDNDGDMDVLARESGWMHDARILWYENKRLIGNLSYTPVTPCRIVDTRKTSASMIGASTERDFYVFGDGATIKAQGGNSGGCPAPSGEPLAAHINLVVANPTGGGNMQAFAVGGVPGANLGVNFADIGSNRANAGIVETSLGTGPDITVASRFSSAHAVIDVLGYYYPDGDLLYTPVKPCRIVDTRKTSAGIIGASTQRNFRVFGLGGTISAQGGNSAGCPAPSGEPLAAHINMVAVSPSGKGNMQAFAVGGKPGANLGVNFAAIGTNFANAGTVETSLGAGPDITATSRYSSAHAVISVLGYYYPDGDFTYTPVTPCRIVDTRKTSAGMIAASTKRDFYVYGSGSTISAQGGNSAGCPAPSGEPLAAHINLVVANPTGQGNMQAFAVGGKPGANLGVNFAAIGTNFANAGTVQTATGSGPDIRVTSRFSSAHAVISVLGYYYPAP